LLREQGVEPEIVKYLEDPPSEATIRRLLDEMEMEPRTLLRKREQEYKELGLADEGKSDTEIIAAIAAHPRLMERPIVAGPRGTVMGRPTERVLEVI
jgi:arsenate reductase